MWLAVFVLFCPEVFQAQVNRRRKAREELQWWQSVLPCSRFNSCSHVRRTQAWKWGAGRKPSSPLLPSLKRRGKTLLLHLLRAWLNCLDTAFGPCADPSLCGPLPSTLKMHRLDRQSPGTLWWYIYLIVLVARKQGDSQPPCSEAQVCLTQTLCQAYSRCTARPQLPWNSGWAVGGCCPVLAESSPTWPFTSSWASRWHLRMW